MTRLLWCLCAASSVVGLSGCGGGAAASGVVASIDRTISGRLTWPAALGPVTVRDVRALDVRTGRGAVEPALSGGTAPDSTSYQIQSVPSGKLVMLEARGETSGGVAVRLAAIIGQAVGRAEGEPLVTVDLAPATTIAALAVDQMARGGVDVASVTAQRLSNLETAAAEIAASVDFTSGTGLDTAASQILSATTNGSVAPLPLAQTRAITLDGSPDDWSGLAMMLTDPAGDGGPYSGLDLTGICVAQDDQSIYVRLDRVGGVLPDNEYSNLWIYFDSFQTGMRSFAIECFHSSPTQRDVRLYDTAGGSGLVRLSSGLASSFGATTAEVAVPKNLLALEAKYKLRAFTHHTAGYQWTSEGDTTETAAIRLNP